MLLAFEVIKAYSERKRKMGEITTRFQNLINEKKAALQNLQGEALLKANAEVIYMEHAFKECIKKTKDPEIWDKPGMKKTFLDVFDKGKYDQTRQARINQIQANIVQVKERINFVNPDTPLPEAAYEYALNPSGLNDETAGNLRETLYNQGYELNLTECPPEGVLEWQKDAIEKKLGMVRSQNMQNHQAVTDYLVNSGLGKKLDEYAKRTNLMPQRHSTHAYTFVMYLIAKKNLSYPDAMKIIPGHKDFEDSIKEFAEFLRLHPTKPLEAGVVPDDKDNIAVTSGEMANNAKEILEIFDKTAEYFKTYQIPDLDYEDPNSIVAADEKIGDLSNFIQDLGQQQEMFLGQKVFAKMPGEVKASNAKMLYPYEIVRFAKMYDEAFHMKRNNIVLQNMPDSYYKSVTANRMLFNQMANSRYRGKTGEQLLENKQPVDLYNEQLNINCQSRFLAEKSITAEECANYCQRRDKNFETKVQPIVDTATNELKAGFNYGDIQSTVSDSFGKLDPDTASTFKRVFGTGNNEPQVVIEEVSKANSFEKVEESVNVFYNKLFVENGRLGALRMAGVENPLTILKIDGQSAQERYGDKYTDYKNEDEAHKYILMEFLNEMYQGDHKVTMDTFVINNEGQYVEGDPWIITNTNDQFEKTKSFLRNVEDFHNLADSLKDEVDKPEYSFNSGRWEFEFLEYHKEALKASMEKLIEESSLGGRGTITSLTDAWKEYQETSKTFYDVARQMLDSVNATEEEYRGLEKFRLITENRLAEQISRVINSTKDLDCKLVPGETDPAKASSFSHIYDRLKEQADVKGYSANRTLLRDETMEDLPEEYNWVNNIDDMDSDIPLEDAARLIEEGRISIAGDVPDKYIANLVNIKNTDFEEIIGKNITPGDFLKKAGIDSGRATGQNVFMFYCMGEKGLSLRQAMQLKYAHDVDENGEYINKEAHKTALAYEKEFIKFVKKYPQDPEAGFYKNRQEAKDGATAWMKIYKNFSEKLKEHTWPDIDYSDPEQVKENFEELYTLHNMCLDGHQEIDRFLEATGYKEFLDPASIGKDVFGSENEYWKTRQFFATVQGITNMGFKEPYFTEFVPSVHNFSRISKIALFRANNADFMSTFAGKPIGSSFVENDRKAAFSLGCGEQYGHLAFGNTRNVLGQENPYPNPKDAVAFLTGRNKTAIKEWFAPFKKYFDDAYRRGHFPASVWKTFCSKINTTLKNEEERRSILLLKDDAQSMTDYMTSPVGKRTGKDVILSQTSLWFDRYERDFFYRFGLKESDMFVIDGKTPKELWGQKYATVQDEDLKENLYRAEILKCIAKGNSTIAMRGINMSEDYVMSVSEPKTLLLPKEKMRTMHDAYLRYAVQKRDILSHLKQMKEELQDTEPAGSVFGRDGGSERYVAFTKAIQEAIQELTGERAEAPKGQYNRIKEKLTNLEKAASVYYEANKDSIRNKQKTRAALAGTVKEGVVSKLENEHKEFAVDYMIDGENNLLDTNEFLTNVGGKHLAEAIGLKTFNLQAEVDKYAREQILDYLRKLEASDEYKKIMNVNPPTTEKRALQYLVAVCRNNASEALPGEEKKKLLTCDDIRKAERIMKDVPKYANNLLFQKYMEEDPNKTVKVWADVEKGAETLRTGYANLLEKYKNDSDSLTRYVGGTKKGEDPNLTLTEQVRRNIENPNEETRKADSEAMYHRLAEVVWLQILAKDDEVSLQIREGIQQDGANYDRYLSAVKSILKQAAVLSTTKLAETTEKHLNNEKLADDALKILQKSAWETKKNLDTARKNAEAANDEEYHNRYDFIYGEPRDWTQEDVDQISADCGLNTERTARQHFNKCADILKKDITYTDAQGNAHEVKASSDAYKNLGLYEDTYRQPMFILWTMATMDKSFEEAVELCNRMPGDTKNGVPFTPIELNETNQARANFHEFCVQNRTYSDKDAQLLDPQKQRNAYKNWAKIFHVGTEKFKTVTLPDIDYRKEDQILANLEKIQMTSVFAKEIFGAYRLLFKSNHKVDGRDILAGELGGEEKLKEFGNFWLNANAATHPLYEAHYNKMSAISHEIEGFEDDDVSKPQAIVSFAGIRYLGATYMQQLKGMTMEQAAQYAQQNDWALSGDEMLSPFEDVISGGDSPIKATPESAVRYLNGKNAQDLEKATEDYKNQMIDKSYKLSSDSLRSALGRFVEFLDWGKAGESLARIPDNDVGAMVAFLNSEGNYSDEGGVFTLDEKGDEMEPVSRAICSGETFLTKNIHNLFGNNYFLVMAMEKLGIKQVDMFLIDGKTPTEKYADKYVGIQDETLKEKLLYLEVMREIAIGRCDVSLRSPAIKDGKFVEDEPLKVVPKRDAAFTKIAENVHRYPFGIEELIRELNVDKKTLSSTQRNKKANFEMEPESEENPNHLVIKEEGESEYKKLTKDLKVLLNKLQMDSEGRLQRAKDKLVDKKDITDSFDNLIASADKYYKTHSWSLRKGLWTKKGRARKSYAYKMRESVRALKEQYLELRKTIEADYTANKLGLKYKDTGFMLISGSISGLEKKLGIPTKTEEQYRKDYYLNKYLPIYEEFMNTPARIPADMKINYSRVNQYFTGIYEDMKKGNFDDVYIKSPAQLEKQFHSLAKNPAFQNMMADKPRYCIQKWKEVERDAEDIKQKVVEKLTKIKENYTNSAAYIVGLPALKKDQRAYRTADYTTQFEANLMGVRADSVAFDDVNATGVQVVINPELRGRKTVIQEDYVDFPNVSVRSDDSSSDKSDESFENNRDNNNQGGMKENNSSDGSDIQLNDAIQKASDADSSFDYSGNDYDREQRKYLDSISKRAAAVILWQMIAVGDEYAVGMIWAFAADETMGFGASKDHYTLFEEARDAIADDLMKRGAFTLDQYKQTMLSIMDKQEVNRYRDALPALCKPFRDMMSIPGAPIDYYLNDYNNNEQEYVLDNDEEDINELNTIVNRIPTIRPTVQVEEAANENLLENNVPHEVNPNIVQPGEQGVNLLEQPKPKFMPVSHAVIQPVIPEFGRPEVQRAILHENLPIIDDQVVIPPEPMINIPVLEPVPAPVPNQQIIQNAMPFIPEQMQPQIQQQINPQPQIQVQPQPNPLNLNTNVVLNEIKPKVQPKPQNKIEDEFINPDDIIDTSNHKPFNTHLFNDYNQNKINIINENKIDDLEDIFGNPKPKKKGGVIGAGDYLTDEQYDRMFGGNKIDPNEIMSRSSWMFPLERGTKLTPEMMKTGDVNYINQVLEEDDKKGPGEKLPDDDRKYLESVRESVNLMNSFSRDADKKMSEGQNPGKRLPVRKLKNGVEILGTVQGEFQTSHNGCWSCSASLLLQGRGLANIGQEAIRSFRFGNDVSKDKNLPEEVSNEYNKDTPVSIINSGDLLTSLAPDSMVREIQIHKRPQNSKLNDAQYLNKAVAVLSDNIRKAIEHDQSPVSLLRHEHYVTIVGIDMRNNEPWVKIKDSMAHPGDTDPDNAAWYRLKDVIHENLNAGKMMNRAVSITWLADVKMDKDTGRITNAPSKSVFVGKDGNVKFPDKKIQDNTDLQYKDPRHQNGTVVATMGGEERTDFNMLSKDGLLISDKAYIPKKLDYNFLLNKAKKSNFEIQVEQAKERLDDYIMPDPKDEVEEYQDKLHCAKLLAAEAMLKAKKLPLDDKSGKAAYETLNKDPKLIHYVTETPGPGIVEDFEEGKLLSEIQKVVPPVNKGGAQKNTTKNNNNQKGGDAKENNNKKGGFFGFFK